MKRVLAILLSVLLISAFTPAMALADAAGDFTVTGGTAGSDYAYANNTLEILSDASLVIGGTTLQDRIIVDAGVTAMLTLDGVGINLGSSTDETTSCPLYISDGANVTLVLKDGTTSALAAGEDNPGIRTGAGTSLTIQSDGAGTGTMHAYASARDFFPTSAGIGGTGTGNSYGTITINSGTVTGAGSINGAGIGGGYSDIGGSVIVNGGTVQANSGSLSDNSNGAAGIGGGYGGTGAGSVAIHGGTVTATGGVYGAGIGTGGYGAVGYTVQISGGTVTANSRSGAAIGSGSSAGGGSIAISGGTVTANGGNEGAGIGGVSGCVVNISGGNIIAVSGEAGIGSGYNEDGCEVNISGGMVMATSNGSAAGIGGGMFGKGGNITISGGTVTAVATNRGAGIGGGENGSGGNVQITGGTVKATGGGFGAQAIGHGAYSSNSGTLTNGSEPVYLTTITLADRYGNALSGTKAISSLKVTANSADYDYGIADTSTDGNGTLYLYLPQGALTTAAVTTEPANYYGAIQTASGESSGMLRLESAPEIDTAALPDATLGTAYSQAIGHIGTEPIAWTIVDGSLPEGLSLDADTGTITGTPTTADPSTFAAYTSTFTVRAENAQGSIEKQFSINVCRPPIVISDDPLDYGMLDTGYSYGLQAAGLPTIMWNVQSGSLPNGIALGSDGTLSGAPTEVGYFTFMVTATNGTETASKEMSLSICPIITTTSLPDGTVGTPYSQTLTAAGLSNPEWFVFGSLPAGLSLDQQTGVLCGTPTESWDNGFFVIATNAELSQYNIYGSTPLGLKINPATPAATPTATPAATPTATPAATPTVTPTAPPTATATPEPTPAPTATATPEPAPTPVPGPFSSFRATPMGATGVRLTWNAVRGVTQYELYRATSASGAFARIATTSATGYTNTGLTAGRAYYYKVRARFGSGTRATYSVYSAVLSAKPVPAAPTRVTATSASYNSVKITWHAVAGATHYEVYRTDGGGATRKVADTASTSCTNTKLTTGTLYRYSVRAYRLVGHTRVYGEYLAAVSVTPVLTASSWVRADRFTASGVRVTWHAVAGATGYEVYRSTSKNGSYKKVLEAGASRTTDTGLPARQVFYYRVKAYRVIDGVRVYSPWSAAARVRT